MRLNYVPEITPLTGLAVVLAAAAVVGVAALASIPTRIGAGHPVAEALSSVS